MFALCTRCIRAIRSRGETVYISNETADNGVCFWCENADDEIFNATLSLFTEYGGMKGGDESR